MFFFLLLQLVLLFARSIYSLLYSFVIFGKDLFFVSQSRGDIMYRAIIYIIYNLSRFWCHINDTESAYFTTQYNIIYRRPTPHLYCRFRYVIAFVYTISPFFTCVSYAEARNRYQAGRPSVCLSVRLSVRPSHAGTLSKRLNILSCFLHHTIAHSFQFCVHQDLREIPTGSSPAGGAKYRWGIKFARFSTNKSLYLANDTRYRHGCHGRRIGTHMRSIKWCHFQRP